jgi:hypothetical protein
VAVLLPAVAEPSGWSGLGIMAALGWRQRPVPRRRLHNADHYGLLAEVDVIRL